MSVNYYKYIVLTYDVNRGNKVWGIWELSVLSSQFFCKYKTVLNE